MLKLLDGCLSLEKQDLTRGSLGGLYTQFLTAVGRDAQGSAPLPNLNLVNVATDIEGLSRRHPQLLHERESRPTDQVGRVGRVLRPKYSHAM